MKKAQVTIDTGSPNLISLYYDIPINRIFPLLTSVPGETGKKRQRNINKYAENSKNFEILIINHLQISDRKSTKYAHNKMGESLLLLYI